MAISLVFDHSLNQESVKPGTIYKVMQPPELPPQVSAADSDRIRAVAKNQKAILWLILINILTFWIPFFSLLTAIVSFVFIFRLCKALNLNSIMAYLCVFIMIIPLINLLVLVILNMQATSSLRAAGIRVGVMGAKQADIDRLP